MNVETLTELAKKFKTDKLDHGYIPHYAKHLPDHITSLLEIGCFKGASLRMWDAAYQQKADIHTIDLFLNPDNMSAREARREEFIVHKGSQADIKFLYTIHEQFDVIIDDGSHNADHQQISFQHLFVNNLRSGGVYVIEDLHCCQESFYWNDHPYIKSLENTMVGALQKLQSEFRMDNGFYSAADSEVLCGLIKQANFYDGKIAFFKRK